MPKGQKTKVVETISMNSKISKENYDKMMSDNIISEIRDGKKFLVKSDFSIQNFYIQNKKGKAHIWKLREQITFGFRWIPSNMFPYIDKCCEPESDNNYFLFSSFEEFDENLKKQYICKYHVSCTNKCCAEYLTSPEEKCAICLNDIQIHLLEETSCGHRFCLSCLNTYVEKKGEKKIPCPTCRRNIRWCHCCDGPMYQNNSACDHDDDNDE